MIVPHNTCYDTERNVRNDPAKHNPKTRTHTPILHNEEHKNNQSHSPTKSYSGRTNAPESRITIDPQISCLTYHQWPLPPLRTVTVLDTDRKVTPQHLTNQLNNRREWIKRPFCDVFAPRTPVELTSGTWFVEHEEVGDKR